jgi:hypothetical protein
MQTGVAISKIHCINCHHFWLSPLVTAFPVAHSDSAEEPQYGHDCFSVFGMIIVRSAELKKLLGTATEMWASICSLTANSVALSPENGKAEARIRTANSIISIVVFIL